jgi:hypothetical protein
MAMIKEMLSTMPAVKVGRLKTMKNLLRGRLRMGWSVRQTGI